jgi:hypothetical protein
MEGIVVDGTGVGGWIFGGGRFGARVVFGGRVGLIAEGNVFDG